MKIYPYPLAVLIMLGGCEAPSRNDATGPAAAAEPNAVAVDSALPQPSPTAAAERAKDAVEQIGAVGEQPRLAVDPEGLRWFLPPNGSARPLGFGSAQAAVLASLERVRGEAAEGDNQDCGAGPVHYASWKDGLSLVFQNGRFAGWSLNGKAKGGITTADGIGIGTTRSALDDAVGTEIAVRQTSLGTEFSAGNYHGLLDGRGADSRITDLWAGVSCVAR